MLRRVIADELAEVAAEHGTPRRTVLVGGDLKALVTARSASLEVADEPVDVLLSTAGLVARTPVEVAADPGSRRTTKRARHDAVVSRARTTARGQVGLVTSAGRVLRVGVLDLPAVPGVTTGALSLRGGAPVSEFAVLERGERVLALTSLRTDSAGPRPRHPQRRGQAGHPRLAGQGRRDRGASRSGRATRWSAPPSSATARRSWSSSPPPATCCASPPPWSARRAAAPAGMAGVKLDAGATCVGFSVVALGGASDTLFDADEPVVVTGAGLPPERGQGPGHGEQRQDDAAVGVPAQGPGDGRGPGAAAAVGRGGARARLGRTRARVGGRGGRRAGRAARPARPPRRLGHARSRSRRSPSGSRGRAPPPRRSSRPTLVRRHRRPRGRVGG